jgi:hypothetical protein
MQHKRPIGACALEMLGGGRALRIVDLVTVPGAWHDALGAVAAHAERMRAAVVDIKLMSLDGRRRQMWRSGFAERDSKPFLVMIHEEGDERLIDEARWFYCGGDSDIDALDVAVRPRSRLSTARGDGAGALAVRATR